MKYHIGVCPKIQLSKRRKFGSPKLDIPIFDQQAAMIFSERFLLMVTLLVLIYRLSNIILFQTIEPRVVEDSIPAYESAVPTPNQEDPINDD